MALPEERVEPQPPNEEEALKACAMRDVEWIRSLMRHPAWEGYFKRRIVEKLGPLRTEILGKKLSLEDYREKQVRMHLLLELLTMSDEDLVANLAILGQR